MAPLLRVLWAGVVRCWLIRLPAPWGRAGLPSAGGWSVAVQDLSLVFIPGGGGAVGVDHEGPALAVDHHLVMVKAEQYAAGEAGGAAVGLVLDVVDLAGGVGLGAAAGPFAVSAGAVADGVADAGRGGG